MDKPNPLVYFDLKIDEERVGRVVIELYPHIVPKTVENFLALCKGDRGIGSTGKPLSYKGTVFHKVIKGVFIQGGDVTNLDGTGGESIFGTTFEDENFELTHNAPGMLSSVNCGEGRNNSQFIITLSECPHLDGTCVVFGKVIKGLSCVVDVSDVKTKDDHPLLKCVIEDCNEIKPGDPLNYEDCDETNDNLPPDPSDIEVPINEIKGSEVVEYILRIKQSGNHFFLKNDYIKADRKYRKAVRYIDWFIPKFSKLIFNDNLQADITLNRLEKEKLNLLLNLSATAIKKGLYRESLNYCDEVLKKDKHNAKAHFRRGKALMCLKDYEAALREQKAALKFAPNDKCIIEEIKNIHNTIKDYLEQEKVIFSKMFYGFN